MKKLMFLAAAAACGAAFAVESANIVGYNSSTLAAGKYNLVSIPFAGVSGGTQKLTEAMSGTWLGGETYEEGDNIRVWNPAGQSYTIYYYYTDDTHQWDGWYDMGGSYYFDDCVENAGGLEAGFNFWYQSKGSVSPTVTTSGAIAPEDDVSITVYGGAFSLISNPFPVAFKPNDSKAVDWGNIHAGETYEDGDNIRIWSASGQSYSIYYYYADDSHQWDGWYDMGGSYYFEDVPGNENGIAAGDVFWYQSKDAKGTNHTIKFYNPTK